METEITNPITVAFINDKSPIIDAIHDSLIASRINVLFREDDITNGEKQLSFFKAQPNICIIDLDFSDKDIISQLRKLRNQHPTPKLIAHSDMDDKKIIKELSELGFSKYILIGEDMKKAIDSVINRN